MLSPPQRHFGDALAVTSPETQSDDAASMQARRGILAAAALLLLLPRPPPPPVAEDEGDDKLAKGKPGKGGPEEPAGGLESGGPGAEPLVAPVLVINTSQLMPILLELFRLKWFVELHQVGKPPDHYHKEPQSAEFNK